MCVCVLVCVCACVRSLSQLRVFSLSNACTPPNLNILHPKNTTSTVLPPFLPRSLSSFSSSTLANASSALLRAASTHQHLRSATPAAYADLCATGPRGKSSSAAGVPLPFPGRNKHLRILSLTPNPPHLASVSAEDAAEASSPQTITTDFAEPPYSPPSPHILFLLAGHPCPTLRATSLSLQGEPADIGKG